MKDEEHHIDFLETQLHLIERIGIDLYTQKHVGGLESEFEPQGVTRRIRRASGRALLPAP